MLETSWGDVARSCSKIAHSEEHMKRRTRERPLHQEGDSKKMTEAIKWAERENLEVFRTKDDAVQIEGYNFWPDVGTIQYRDQKKESERGLRGLARLLKVDPNSISFPHGGIR
jgi:hypothetical protein